MYSAGLYNVSFAFISLTIYLHSRRALLKDYHCSGRPSTAQNSFFLWLNASHPPSFSPHLLPLPPPLLILLHLFSVKWVGMGFFQHGQRWRYCQHELSIAAVCRAGPLLSACHCGARMRHENLGGFVKGEIKHGTQLIRHPCLHGIGPLTHR